MPATVSVLRGTPGGDDGDSLGEVSDHSVDTPLSLVRGRSGDDLASQTTQEQAPLSSRQQSRPTVESQLRLYEQRMGLAGGASSASSSSTSATVVTASSSSAGDTDGALTARSVRSVDAHGNTSSPPSPTLGGSKPPLAHRAVPPLAPLLSAAEQQQQQQLPLSSGRKATSSSSARRVPMECVTSVESTPAPGRHYGRFSPQRESNHAVSVPVKKPQAQPPVGRMSRGPGKGAVPPSGGGRGTEAVPPLRVMPIRTTSSSTISDTTSVLLANPLLGQEGDTDRDAEDGATSSGVMTAAGGDDGEEGETTVGTTHVLQRIRSEPIVFNQNGTEPSTHAYMQHVNHKKRSKKVRCLTLCVGAAVW